MYSKRDCQIANVCRQNLLAYRLSLNRGSSHTTSNRSYFHLELYVYYAYIKSKDI